MRNRQACYWIIGKANKAQAPAVAVDIHAESGELEKGTRTFELPRNAGAREAFRVAARYARKNKIPAARLHYDEDSTAFFATC